MSLMTVLSMIGIVGVVESKISPSVSFLRHELPVLLRVRLNLPRLPVAFSINTCGIHVWTYKKECTEA